MHVLPSGSSPFVLRPQESSRDLDYEAQKFELIGDCHLASRAEALIPKGGEDNRSALAGSLPFEILSMCNTRLSEVWVNGSYGPTEIKTITLT